MAKQGIILTSLVCVSIAMFTGQTLSWASASDRRPMPLFPPAESLRGLSDEEKAKAIEKWQSERERQKRRSSEERLTLMESEAWKRLLRISDPQWKSIKPKVDKVQVFGWSTGARALYGIDWREQRFSWYKHSQGAPLIRAKAPDEMTEGEKLADEFVTLLEHENSTDEAIRQKIDALQKVRENARKELAQIGRELAPLLTSPRQEAIFLIMGYID